MQEQSCLFYVFFIKLFHDNLKREFRMKKPNIVYIIADCKLVTNDETFNSKKLHSLNPLACHGPMRGGWGN